MRKLEEVAKKRRKRGSSRFLDRIARLSDRLQPFFGVVDIMIQSNPEYTALAWGALRFILQLASGFSTFFEKLIKTLERFCREMPQYKDIQLLQEDQISARIKECIEKVYGHMFQLFKEVANVFTSGGRIKRTPVVIAEILWRPFENRFDGLLEEVKSCRSLIEFDIALLQARTANDTKAIAVAQKEIAEEEQEQNRKAQKKADELAKMTDEIARMVSQSYREQLFERIQKWLSPPQYSDALFRGKSLREPGTNEWVLTNTRFCNPGSGKSVLASSIIDELMAEYHQEGRIWELCYFFFTPDCKESTTRISAYRSILAQILHRNRQDEDMINKFDFTMTDIFSSGTPKAGLDELFGLVKLLFQQFQILLVLDGIDDPDELTDTSG
ncbi:hypothetical protein BFW01_g1030 [Lasiodiplodia theobromae]|uniref:NACHT domain-containing protein n=1 Tax=Lasiodiplodia theobromae TaxID=45133 RepID=A0A8H7IR67_9PEZI|nr:hypothetical protein BFW01_g1030 [Lasiodiplodia theobromae]